MVASRAMVAPAAFVVLTLLGPGDGSLHLHAPTVAAPLRATTLLAQTATDAPPADGSPAPACNLDCASCNRIAESARMLGEHRASSLRTHRAFALAAWGGLAVTEALGTVLALNRPTWFGDGGCASGSTSFTCGSGLVALHQTFAFVSTGLYATAGVIAATAPDPDHAAHGDDPASRSLALHKTLAWVHGAGMILMPLLGIVAANPQLVGLDASSDPSGVRSFQSSMRSVHLLVGYATFAALSASAAIELF